MNEVFVITEWREMGGNYSAVELDYPANGQLGESWADGTGQTDVIPSPNVAIWHGVVTDATLAALEADTNYVIITSEVI